MNCRQTQELISAYLDQELTGQQMLEIRAHLRLCPSCARECRETAEMRRLLRALPVPAPPVEVEQRLAARLACPEEPFWMAFAAALVVSRSNPPRGRRLAAALALSCVAVFIAAPPFASQNGDTAISSGSMATLPPLSLSPLSLPMELGSLNAASFAHLTLFHPAPRASPVAPPLPDVGSGEAEPLRDVTAVDYEQGNVALADYQASAPGVR